MSNIIFNSGVKFPSLIIPTGSQPLDSRTIVQNLPTRADEFTEGAVYLGMTVSCLNDKNFYMLEKIENGNLTWKQVGTETVLPDGTLSGSLNGVTSYTGIGEDGTPTYTTVPYTISYSDGKVTGLTLDIDGFTQKKYVDDKIDALAYDVNYTIGNLDVNDAAQTGYYVSYVSQANGKISVGREKLPSTTNGKLTEDMGTAYTWDNATSTHTSAPIRVEISYSNGAITNMAVTGLSDVATKDFIDGKLSYEISKLDAADAAKAGYYVSYVSQTDGKISVGREKLPTVEFPEGSYKGNLGMTYIGVRTNGTPTYTDIPVTISYKDGKVTGVTLPLDSFVQKNYVDQKVSYEISSHDLVDKKYVDDKYDALIGDGKLNDTIDTIKEISYWLDNNPDDAVELTLSLAELTEKVNSNEKTVATDLNEIHTQLDNRYTKSEIDNTLTSYAKSANVYTKTEINNTLASYASVSYVSTRLSWGVI